jgi:hypothetical protein
MTRHSKKAGLGYTLKGREGCAGLLLPSARFPVKGEASEDRDATSSKAVLEPLNEG